MAVGDEKSDRESSKELIALLKAELAERDAKLAERDARLAELTGQITKLTEQVAKLTEVLGRNSKNSHLPPSSDGPGSGSGTSGHASRKSARKRGGQKGHRGAYRELLPPERVDAFVDLFPEVCLGCACVLPRVADVAACRYQQLELRDHRPHVTEWRRHEVDCERCGASTRAGYGAQIPASAFGPCLTAVVAMLTGAYHLSRRKTQKLLRELFGIAVSLGAISAMEQRASEALEVAEVHPGRFQGW